jgi:predicted SAM-dependent methyltransferase
MIKKIIKRIVRPGEGGGEPAEAEHAAAAVPGNEHSDLAGESPGDRELIEAYLGSHGVARLHIGCGENTLAGWLNSDFSPMAGEVIRLDAAKPFPFDDDRFDFIYSEHMIEHLPYAEGMSMLSECYRVLRSGGILRLTTPDLGFLIELYRDDKSGLQEDYIKWATDTFISSAPDYIDTIVINNFFRDWGHQFVYDKKTLRSALERTGFAAITECEVRESRHGDLRGLENKDRMPEGFLELESMVFEAAKP